MGFQFIMTRPLVDKTRPMIEKILAIKQQNPAAKIFYLVPDHIKFDMEEQILKLLRQVRGGDSAAMTDIQVASFKRLGWFLLPKSFVDKPILSDIGNAMLIQSILIQEKDQLHTYRGQIYHQGFIDKLLDLFEELYQADLQPEDLAGIIKVLGQDALKNNPHESQRLKELSYLYTIFRQRMVEQSLDNYQDFAELRQCLDQGKFKQNYYVFIDHYHAFNAQEIALVLALARNFSQTYLCLPITHQQANATSYQPVFDLAKETYQQIRRLLQQIGIEIQPDWDLSQPSKNYHPDIIQTSQLALNYLNQNRIESQQSFASQQEVWSCDSIQTELRHLANQINYLVKVKHYRYQDIIVKTRHLDAYQHIIGPYFADNQIPLFFDHRQTMQGHSLVRLIEAIFDLLLGHWPIQAIISILKSDLVQLADQQDRLEFFHQVNILENIILANGYQAYRFYDLNFEWRYNLEDQIYINHRGLAEQRTIKEVVDPLRKKLINIFANRDLSWQASNKGPQASQWLYQILIKLGVKERLINKRDLAIEEGDLEASRHDEQVWQVLVTMLEEFNQIFSDQKVELACFKNLLLTGFQQASFHIIPPTLDQVVFTSIESPQAKDFKIAFIIGMDELALPSQVNQDSLIKQQSRTLINDLSLEHQFLNDVSSQNYRQDMWLAYLNLLSGQDYLYLSYHQGEGKQDVQLSPYYRALVLNQRLKVYSFTAFQPLDQSLPHPSFLGQATSMVGPVLYNLGQYIHGNLSAQSLSIQHLLSLYHALSEPQRANFYHAITMLDNFSNLPQAIDRQTAIDLFGRNLIASVSKIETFFQDPFAHFIVYGLRLREREEYQITALQAGDYFHEFLDRFVKELQDKHLQIGQLQEGEIADIFEDITQIMSQDYRFNIFSSQARHRFIQGLIHRQIVKSLQSFNYQFNRIHLQTKISEAIFGLGAGHGLRPMQFDLASGGKLQLTGKIDRIDWHPEYQLLQIIDYKTGNKSFNLLDFYYGLDLQIMTYLYVAQKTFPEFIPIGAFYQPLMQQYQKATQADSLQETGASFQINRLDGLVTLAPDQLVLIDQDLKNKGQSLYYPAKITKTGSYNKSASQYIDNHDLSYLYRHIERLFIEAGNQIQTGNIALRPYYEDPYSLSLQKTYRVLTGFDSTVHFEAYRHQYLNKDQVLAKIKEDLQESEEFHD